MGTTLGYISALIVIALCALIGLTSFKASAMTFVSVSYSIWLTILLANFFSRPSKNLPFCQSLSSQEIKAYQKYHIYLRTPDGGAMLSSLLNTLRIAGLAWSGLCIWHEHYWRAGLCLAYLFLTINLLSNLSPWFYMVAKAEIR